MTKYVKNKRGYEETEFEASKIKDAMRRRKGVRKMPTSVALDPDLVEAIKEEAERRGIPYQIMLRMFIVEGFNNLKKAA